MDAVLNNMNHPVHEVKEHTAASGLLRLTCVRIDLQELFLLQLVAKDNRGGNGNFNLVATSISNKGCVYI